MIAFPLLFGRIIFRNRVQRQAETVALADWSENSFDERIGWRF
jgi:hypothetical protein